MTQPFRHASGGRIDRTRTLTFTFDDQMYEGHPGDTLASALLANGVRLIGRSFKYHRPRGIMAAGTQEANAIVDVVFGNARLTNLRATEVELTDGLAATSVNAWPSLSFDLGAVNNLFARFLSAGFYYKTFFLPHWHAYEWAIRRAAGLGRLSPSHETPRADQLYAHCDVLIVGGGPCGLAAAQAASANGARVILVEQDTELGGSALWRDLNIDGLQAAAWATKAGAALTNVRILTRTTATGYYDHNALALLERTGDGHRLWHVRAKRVILATGALERPLVFPGNDRPGIMLATAALEYEKRFAIKLGGRIIVVTNNDAAYEVARSLSGVTTILDTRTTTRAEVDREGIDVHLGATITGTAGGHGVNKIHARLNDGRKLTIPCDAIAMSGGWSPSVHLFSQSGGRLRYDETIAAFVPSISVQAECSVGGANGTFALGQALREAAEEGAAAVGIKPAIIPTVGIETAFAIEPDWTPPETGKAFVDFQNDVTTADLAQSVQENYVSIEHLKRYTTLGMATDQGKSANVNAIGVMSALTGRTLASVGTTRYRPPFTPVPVGAYAGRRRGDLYKPYRRSPLHDWQAAHGAIFEEFGEWQRPAHYLGPGETRDDAMRRETLAVRNTAGLFDNSPLGKIEVAGPDAARFLDFIYANAMSTLMSDRLRYGLMLNEHGVVIDDGVVARLANDRFWVGTTSGGAARIAAMLDEWLQCEFVDYRVVVAPVTADWSVPTITGPRARDVLAKLSPDFDISRDAFPHMSLRTGRVAGIPARVFRASFTGELSYEIYVPSDRGLELWDALAEAGAGHGVEPVGIDAWMVLRTEKGYLHVGSDTDGTTTPDDIGWGHIHRRTGDFVGRRSLLRAANRRDDRYQLVGLEPLDGTQTPKPGEHLRSGTSVTDGYITSSAFSHTLGRAVALAMLKGGASRMGEELALAKSGACVRVSGKAAYDPAGDRLRD